MNPSPRDGLATDDHATGRDPALSSPRRSTIPEQGPETALRASHSLPPRALELVLVRDFDAVAQHRRAWDALLARARTNTVFQTYELHCAWWQAFGSYLRMHLMFAYDGDRLVGIAPLAIRERAALGVVRRRIVQFIGTRSFDYADFIVERGRDDVVPFFMDRLLEDGHPFDLLYLRDLPDTSATIAELVAYFRDRDVPVDASVLYKAPTRIFNDPAADRRLPNKKSLRRHHNHLQRLGRVTFKPRLSGAEARRYLDAFFEQHVRRRAGTDTPSVFIDQRARVFFTELVQALSPRGWLLFSVLELDGEPVAMHVGFEYGNRIIWYKPAFDPEHAKRSPGEVLIKHLLEYALERKVEEFDFTIGEEPFKYRFANHVRSNYVVRAYRRPLDRRVHGVVLGGRALVERWPALARILRRLLARWRGAL